MHPITAPLRQYMHSPVHTTAPGTSIGEASLRMTELSVSSLPVVDAHGRAVGLITRTDLLRVGIATFLQGFAARRCTESGVQLVIVTDDTDVRGVVSASDFLHGAF
ncbi:MAG TPA: CBS domain-containing protein [Polyangiales bacterium]